MSAVAEVIIELVEGQQRISELAMLDRVSEVNPQIRQRLVNLFLHKSGPFVKFDSAGRPMKIRVVFVEALAAIVQEAQAWEESQEALLTKWIREGPPVVSEKIDL